MIRVIPGCVQRVENVEVRGQRYPVCVRCHTKPSLGGPMARAVTRTPGFSPGSVNVVFVAARSRPEAESSPKT
jgi:hypothetical protein